jgi:uncharacterized protein
MLPLAIFVIIIITIDLYAYKGLKMLWQEFESASLKRIINIVYWLIPFMLLTSVVLVIYFRPVERDPKIFNGYLYIVAFAFMFYLPKLFFLLFHLIEDIVHLTGMFIRRFGKPGAIGKRWKLLSRAGLIIAIIPFLAIVYGMVIGRFDFQVINKQIEHAAVPSSFDGFRILHISDLHIGSFVGYESRVSRAVEIINGQKPDLIVFTGDLVNNFTSEIDGFVHILRKLDAPYGIYSILGNHDYGDYYQWESEEAKELNMQQMLVAHQEIGFRLLMNEWDSLVVDGETIALIGVENWGAPPFPQYGDLEKAAAGTENFPFRILLTHDPSHWDAEVLGNSNIELTLAGHTHGFQFGIELGNISWSPSKFKYPRWGGKYRENDQFLYVNRGLGFVGFPGRVGMPPEITVIELKVAK